MNGRCFLERISREKADAIAAAQYNRFEERRREALEEDALKQLTETAKKLPAPKTGKK